MELETYRIEDDDFEGGDSEEEFPEEDDFGDDEGMEEGEFEDETGGDAE